MLTLVKHTFDDRRNEKCCRQDRKMFSLRQDGPQRKSCRVRNFSFPVFSNDHLKWTDISIHRVLSAVKHLSRAALEVDSFEQRLQDVNKFSHERFHCWCCQEEDKDRKKLMQDASEIYFCRINNLPSCLSSREKTRAFLRRKTASQAIAKQFFKRNHNIRFRQVKNIRLLLIQFEAEASPESLALYQASQGKSSRRKLKIFYFLSPSFHSCRRRNRYACLNCQDSRKKT